MGDDDKSDKNARKQERSYVYTLRVESFAGSKFRVYKLSRTPEVKINFRG
jgi:hypothetical protein